MTTKEILFRRFLCARGWKIQPWSAGGPSGLSVQMQVRCKWRLFVLHVWAFMWGVLRLHVCWRTGTHHGAGGDFSQRMQVRQILLPEKTLCGQLYKVSGVSQIFFSPFSLFFFLLFLFFFFLLFLFFRRVAFFSGVSWLSFAENITYSSVIKRKVVLKATDHIFNLNVNL